MCSCLVAKAEETERTRQIEAVQEKVILEEFGRCLLQVIESSKRNHSTGLFWFSSTDIFIARSSTSYVYMIFVLF